MNFQQCHYLLAVHQYGSISQAAQALFVTQPSISKAIRELESELGIQILQRSNKGVRFTKDGQDLLQYATVLVEEERNLHQHFQQPHDQMRLTVSSQHFSFVTQALAETSQSLTDQQYQFILHEGHAHDVIHEVATGVATVGVLAIASQNRQLLTRQFSNHQLVFHPLIRSSVHVFLHAEHPLAKHSVISPDELNSYPDLSYRRNDPALSMIEGPAITQHPDRQTIFVNDRATMDQLLLHTNGYNIGTGVTSKDYITPGLVAVPLAEPWQMTIGYLDHGQLSNVVAQKFVSFLQAALE